MIVCLKARQFLANLDRLEFANSIDSVPVQKECIQRVKRDVMNKKKEGKKERKKERKKRKRETRKKEMNIYDNIERIDRYYRAPTRFFLFDKFSFEKLTRFESNEKREKKKEKEKEREKNMSRR